MTLAVAARSFRFSRFSMSGQMLRRASERFDVREVNMTFSPKCDAGVTIRVKFPGQPSVTHDRYNWRPSEVRQSSARSTSEDPAKFLLRCPLQKRVVQQEKNLMRLRLVERLRT